MQFACRFKKPLKTIKIADHNGELCFGIQKLTTERTVLEGGGKKDSDINSLCVGATRTKLRLH